MRTAAEAHDHGLDIMAARHGQWDIVTTGSYADAGLTPGRGKSATSPAGRTSRIPQPALEHPPASDTAPSATPQTRTRSQADITRGCAAVHHAPTQSAGSRPKTRKRFVLF